MIKMVHNFILKIQNSDESTKRFWLVALSGISMIVVIAFWLVYMNLTVVTVAPSQSDTAIAIENSRTSAPGFFAIFGAGAKIIYDKVAEIISAQVSAKNNIVIENPERNFVLEGLTPISPTKLETRN